MNFLSFKEKLIRFENLVLPTLVFSIYTILFIRLDRGTSCDEGYYLIGYNINQKIGWGVSDFHSIIRFLFSWLNYDNALELRYIRFILNILSLVFFASSSYKYLKINYHFKSLNVYNYYSIILLSGALSFGFASPVLYYDNLQLILYLCSLGLLLTNTYKQSNTFLFYLGIIFFISITNYLPSGILLIFSNLLILKIHDRLRINYISIILIGVISCLLFYHYFIHDLKDYYIQTITTFKNAQIGNTRHSSLQLLTTMLKFLVFFYTIIIIFFFIVRILSNYFSKYKNDHFVFVLSILTSIVSFLLIKKIHTTVVIIPVIFMLGISYNHIRKIGFRQLSFLFIIFSIPFMGIFGTNQPIESKLILFVTFWTFLFCALLSKIKSISIKYNYLFKYLYVFFTIYLFLTYGYFNKYHYYYTPNKSTYKLTGLNRFNGIKVSSDQKKFIYEVDSILKINGFKPGDEMITFEVDLITAYAVGAQIPNNLFYGQYNMTVSPNNIPSKKIKYIMLYSGRKNEFINYIKHTNWNFPSSYKEYYLGKYAINMPESMNSILYIAK